MALPPDVITADRLRRSGDHVGECAIFSEKQKAGRCPTFHRLDGSRQFIRGRWPEAAASSCETICSAGL